MSPTTTTRTKLRRSLACALIASSIAAPAAFAAPQDLRSPDTRDAAEQSQPPASPVQDLRSPDARDAATRPQPASPGQDLRSPDARDAATRPQPVAESSSVTLSSEDSSSGGFDWSTAGISVAILSGLGLFSYAVLTGVRHRRHVARS
jgi:hypothetical protein